MGEGKGCWLRAMLLDRDLIKVELLHFYIDKSYYDYGAVGSKSVGISLLSTFSNLTSFISTVPALSFKYTNFKSKLL